MSGPPSNIPGIKEQVGQRFPALQPYMNLLNVQWGDPAKNPGGGHLEFYPPWESENPTPGVPAIELFDPRLQGNALRDAIAGDTLHYVGAIDPRNGRPVDPKWMGLKNDLRKSLTPEQLAVDRRTYDRTEGTLPNPRPFEDWMQDSRTDAYIRGYITPDANDEWRKQGVYNPAQVNLLTAMKQYLLQPPVSPQNMPPSNAMDQVMSRGIWEKP